MEAYFKTVIQAHCPVPNWLRKIGAVGFCFFLIKGLLWLTVPPILYWFST